MVSRRSFLISTAGAALAAVHSPTKAEIMTSNVEIAKFHFMDTVEDLVPTTGGTTMQFQHVTMPPGIYAVGNQSYDCTRAGLYKFKVKGELFHRVRIVYGSPADLYATVSAVCWNHIHGTQSEAPISSMQAISDQGRFMLWRMRCGFIGNYMAWLLPQLGFSVRQVGVISAPANRNGGDDGHQVLEVMHGGKWVMFDLTNGVYWKNASGVHLSTTEFIAHIANNGPFPDRVLLDGNQRRWGAGTVTLPGGQIMDLEHYGDYIDNVMTLDGWIREKFYQIDA